jgi:aspartate oxidase
VRNGISDFYRTRRLDDGLIGLRNAAQWAWLICHAAMRNRRSRGVHWREEAAAA